MLIGDTFLNLLDLRSYPGVVDVAIGVQTSKGVQGLFLLTLVHKPARRLGEDEDERTEDECGNTLDTEGDSPLSVVGVVVVCAPTCPTRDESTDAQHELLESGNSACLTAGQFIYAYKIGYPSGDVLWSFFVPRIEGWAISAW